MKKRSISLLLILAMACSLLLVPAGAISSSATDFSEYVSYTIDLAETPPTDHMITSCDTDSISSVERAIAFVESLNLEQKGFDYIANACLAELEDYKDSGVSLKQYTVLTPKNGPAYFGTLNGADYYYTDTSIAVGTKTWFEKLTDTGITDEEWLNALGSLLFVLASHTALYPLTAGMSATSAFEPAHISKDDEFQMSVAFTNCYQRAIGRYDSQGNFRILYYDQRGKATYDIDFRPGNPADYGNNIDFEFYENHSAVDVKTYEYDNPKEQIMQVCQTYYNRPSSGYVKYSLLSSACRLIHQAT